MDIHEYQAKEILHRFGVPIPRGALAYSPEQAAYRSREIGGDKWVVKAQVHSGGRGEAGGVKVCDSDTEIRDFSGQLFGRKLVTRQTGERGKLVGRVYVEEALAIAQELYLGLVLDRASERIMVVASAQGGMEIEELSEEHPDAILRMTIDPATGFLEYQARELAFGLGLDSSQVAQAAKVFRACYRAFRDLDATMVEINPLIVTQQGDLVALDAKMSFDDNALFRRNEIAELRDMSQEDPLESHAADRGLSYVSLDGNIGCMINGAGLAMATMDMIKLMGGAPANFLDIGGGASPERVLTAFRTVLTDPKVEAILVNIFAGINRCDWIAEGVVQAFEKAEIKVPVIVRLSGTNVEEGRRILEESQLPVATADTLAEAAEKAVAAVSRSQAA